MLDLQKPVARVFRRLRYQRFLTALVWSWAMTLAIVACLIAAEKLLNRTLPGPSWVPFAVAAGVGLVIAAVFSLATGPSRLDAAIALDRVFHLNERVSTALTLPADLRSTPAGEACWLPTPFARWPISTWAPSLACGCPGGRGWC